MPLSKPTLRFRGTTTSPENLCHMPKADWFVGCRERDQVAPIATNSNKRDVTIQEAVNAQRFNVNVNSSKLTTQNVEKKNE